ncbi:MAG: polymer-forming cytoskeletal protein [Phycisphaerae bacterium]|nr:polymer-forming cytoskeletal protein [Phycisphaerae bacterium]
MPEPTNQTTIIGPDTTLKGELTFENSARIMGRVEGKVSSKGEVTIGDGAACKATIDAGRVLVDGVVEGNITAKEKVQLNAKARVVGDITALTLVVSEGASFTGHCRVGADAAKRIEAEAAQRTRTVTPPQPRPGSTPSNPTPHATPAATDGLAAAFAGLEAKLAGISKPRTAETVAE